MSYDIILPLLLCSVIAYYTAKSLEGASLYSEALKRKAAAAPDPGLGEGRVADLIAGPTRRWSRHTARFAEIARMFLRLRVNNILRGRRYGRFLGVVSLHDIMTPSQRTGISRSSSSRATSCGRIFRAWRPISR